MTYVFLQQYWWFVVSLLGALLVFLLFVQGGNSLIFCLDKPDGWLPNVGVSHGPYRICCL